MWLLKGVSRFFKILISGYGCICKYPGQITDIKTFRLLQLKSQYVSEIYLTYIQFHYLSL